MKAGNYGIVKFIKGSHKGNIGYYDDDEGGKAIVYFGSPLFPTKYAVVPYNYLDDSITTNDLLKRQETIIREYHKSTYRREMQLSEFILIESEFSDRYMKTRFINNNKGKKCFISHSSLDITFAKLLATDLVNAGHVSWLDIWDIKVGQSIPAEISRGLEDCDYVILVLSKNSVCSNWVENEWQAKYWNEVESGRIQVLPVLLEQCKVPTLIKHKKYADFSRDYSSGLESLLDSVT